jgi:hypothetical protein
MNIEFATGFNLPPFWLNRPVKVLPVPETGTTVPVGISGTESDVRVANSYLGNLYQDTVEIKWEDESTWWRLPFDPVVSVSGKNVIVRRTVLKVHPDRNRRGSVKELWSQDDYEINIAGVFMGAGEFPENDLRTLRRYCESRQTVEVKSRLLTIFNVERLAIENFSLPFTKGIENQMYSIKAYSDEMFDLLKYE